MAANASFPPASSNVQVSEVWVVETVDIELAAHHAVVETCRFAWTGSVPRYSSAPHWERITSTLGHVWTAPWQELLFDAHGVRCRCPRFSMLLF